MIGSKRRTGSSRSATSPAGAAPSGSAACSSRLQIEAQRTGIRLPVTSQTPYVNSIPVEKQPRYPGDLALERRIKSVIRWNAMAMVVEANMNSHGIGGHISTYASAATLHEVGFTHFWRGPDHPSGGDLVYFPGPLRARHLRPRLRAGPPQRRPAARLPPRAARRAPLLPAPLAAGRLLAIRHGLDGPRPDPSDLPGPFHPLPRKPRASSPRPTARSGASSATARRTSRRRSARSRSRPASSSTT